MLQPEYPLTWTCFGALYKGKSKDSCSSQNITLHGHVSGLYTKVSQKLHALARISPYMDMCRGSVQRQVKSFMLQPEYPLTWTCVGALYKGKSKASCSSQNIPLHGMCRGSVQRQVKSFMLQPEYPLTWTCFGALYKGKSKASCSSQNIPLHGHVSGLCTKASQKLHALARISPYMNMFRGSVQRQVKSFMLQPEYPLTWTCVGALYKGKSKASCSSQNIHLHGHVSGLCTKASQKHALARISPYMNMFRGSVQRQVKSFMLQPEYPLTWTCVGALYKGKSKASCSSQNIPLHEHVSGLCTKASQKLHALASLHGHVSGLCTKASQKLHALARISPYMDMFRGSVQRQVKRFMLQPEYPLTWTCVGALFKGQSKALCSSQNIPLHGHISGLCTKATQKLHVLARISPDMDMCRGSVQRQVKSFMLQPEYPLTWTCFGALYKGKSKASCSSQNITLMDMFRGSVQRQVKSFMLQPEYPLTWTCVGAQYKGKSKASCSSQNIPLHGHVSGLCTKASQKLHALARISPYMDMCRGYVQRQVKSFMLQPEYPLTWTCVGALYKGKSKASCSSQNIPLHGHVQR